MKATRDGDRPRVGHRLLAGIVLGIAAAFAASPAANAATTATFGSGVLSVFGDGAANAITISRDSAGRILVNNGAIAVSGGTPTVANTSLLRVFGQSGNDAVTLDEANGDRKSTRLNSSHLG